MDKRFSHAVEAIYSAAADPSLWPVALQSIAGVFGDVGAVLIWRREGEGFGTIVSPSLQHGQEAFEKHWWRLDIRTIRGAEALYAGEKDVLCDADVATPEEIETHPIYTQFLPSLGIGWFGAASVAPEPKVSLMISVQRAKAKPPFTREELGVVHALARHVEKAFRLSLRLFEAERLSIRLSEALERLDIGVVAVDEAGQAVFSNEPARKALLLRGTDDELRLASPQAREAIRRALAAGGPATDANAALKPFAIPRPAPFPPLIAYCFPAMSGPVAADTLLTRARAIILLFEPNADEPADPALLRDFLGLTLGEARVAALVGFGVAPKAAAERLGIAESTARTVLKRVFAKTGISRQSELVALLSRVAALAAADKPEE